MSAIETLQVIEHVLVNDFAQGRTRCAPGCAADEASDNCASKAAEQCTDWACDQPDRCASLGAGECHCCATHCTSNCAGSSANLCGSIK
ncbi:hypothetical protein [Pandoraea sp.]|uniref:hypothetical protein n=1 Tax=Pandoraea sp. TaxID=1883445 RepID=UPI0035B24709